MNGVSSDDDAAGEVPLSDSYLMARISSDPEALETLYRRYVRVVTAFVAHRAYGTLEPDLVGDVVADTFLRAIRGAHTFDARRARGNARVWLLAIANNELRRHRRVVLGQRRAVDRHGSLSPPTRSNESDWAADVDAQRLRPALVTALGQLSRVERDAVLLVDLEGLSSREAARVTGSTDAATRARLSRARRRLRSALNAGSDASRMPYTLPSAYERS